MQFARIKAYKKDLNTGDIILIANITDSDGKPLMVEGDQNDVETRFSQDGLQKLIREELPTEEKRMQELIDKIHKLRLDRVLNIENIDKGIEEIRDKAVDDFTNCTNKLDIAKTSAIYRVKLLALAQKRLLSKSAIHEESELKLQLAMLKHSTS